MAGGIPSPIQAAERPEGELLTLVRPSLPPLEDYVEALKEIWRSRIMSNATFVKRFEDGARAYTGREHALAVVSCDIGLTLTIAALEIPKGSEVVMPSFTFNSTANAVLWNGLEPRFVDIDPSTYCIDPAAASAAVGERTGLILGTHVFGVPCDVEALERIAEERGVPLMFDAAQAFGAFVDDRHVSSFADASVFSFSESKVVTSGQGGLAVFRSPEPADRFRYLRAYGFQGDYVTRYVGLNGKMSEILAALACLSIAGVEDEIDARKRVAEVYRSRLGTLVRFQQWLDGVRPSPIHLSIEVEEDRDALLDHLGSCGIPAKTYFRPLHWMPLFQNHEPLPVTDRLAATLVCLPFHAGLTEGEIEYVCDRVRDFLERR